MRLRRFLSLMAGTALAITATSAQAGRGSIKDAPYAPLSWTGLYLGLHAGGGWGDADWKFPAPGNFFGATGTAFSAEPDGTLIGGHIGYNQQFGAFVAGVEISYSGSSMRDRVTGPVAAFPQDRFGTEIEDLFTATGRIGYAAQNWLLYAKGGYANAEVEIDGLSGIPVAGVTFDTSNRLAGWTVGGGFDYRLHRNAVLGIEYNYVDLGGDRFTTRTGGTVLNLPFSTDLDVSAHTVTARFSILLQ
jgi:outer membrane immunogenic protein